LRTKSPAFSPIKRKSRQFRIRSVAQIPPYSQALRVFRGRLDIVPGQQHLLYKDGSIGIVRLGVLVTNPPIGHFQSLCSGNAIIAVVQRHCQVAFSRTSTKKAPRERKRRANAYGLFDHTGNAPPIRQAPQRRRKRLPAASLEDRLGPSTGVMPPPCSAGAAGWRGRASPLVR
jgi:hypothetical protein